MACSNIRYGEGVTSEVGMDLINLGIKNTCVFTDKNVLYCVHVYAPCNNHHDPCWLSQLVNLPPVAAVLDSLHANGVHYSLYDDVSIEPTNSR